MPVDKSSRRPSTKPAHRVLREGEVRQATGTSPSNYTYTGQYSHTADFGLMFYNARWYDPALGRFAQADTIVPGGVQGLDRYAYTGNNPINYTDPSGHCRMDATADDCLKSDKSNAPTSEENFESKFQTFYQDALRIAKNKGKRDTLEGMARIVENAAETFNGDWNDMMKALGLVFSGTSTYGFGTLREADRLAGQNKLSGYYLGEYFSDAGFNEYYQDGSNQIGHVWGFIANTTVLPGTVPHAQLLAASYLEATVGNNKHEFFAGGPGGSRQDFLLSRAGMQIGYEISNGNVSPDDLANLLHTNLGTEASVDNGFVWQYWALPDAQE